MVCQCVSEYVVIGLPSPKFNSEFTPETYDGKGREDDHFLLAWLYFSGGELLKFQGICCKRDGLQLD